MSLFGTTTSNAPSLFGTTSSTPATNTLFGSSTVTSAAPTGGLFGSTATTTAPATGGLFGSAAKPATTTSGGLFGASSTTTTAPTAGTLFGATPAATTTSTGGLFGSTTTTTTATPSLFGASTTTNASTTGGLFGAKPASTGTTTLGGGLFGAATSNAPASTTGSIFGSTTPGNTALGLGGVQQKTDAVSSGTTGSLTGGEKETTKVGEIPSAAQIREMLPLIEERLKKNREIIEDVESMNMENPAIIDELVVKTRGWISEVRRRVRESNYTSQYCADLISEDKMFLETAKRLQDATTTSNQTALTNVIKQHLFNMTDNYDVQMSHMQQRIEGIRTKLERLLNGETALSMSELDEMFQKCDKLYANAKYHIEETGREIESVKNVLIDQGYTHLRKSYLSYPSKEISLQNEGAEFFPSHSSLAVIGSSLRAPATTAPAVGGLGLSTGSGLFGSTTGGTSLFGSTTASKPAFSGGSLFGNLTSTATTTTTPASTTTTSLFGSKPATQTSFASTVSNNSSGLLFSMKK